MCLKDITLTNTLSIIIFQENYINFYGANSLFILLLSLHLNFFLSTVLFNLY